jgi:hypothetical protein
MVMGSNIGLGTGLLRLNDRHVIVQSPSPAVRECPQSAGLDPSIARNGVRQGSQHVGGNHLIRSYRQAQPDQLFQQGAAYPAGAALFPQQPHLLRP